MRVRRLARPILEEIAMRLAALVCITVLASASAAMAQDPMTTAAKSTLGLIKGNVVKAAEQMSEENYAFKATPDVRSFGQIIGHVANANYMICSSATGAANPSKDVDIEKTKTTKADLTKALAESFAICDAQFDALTPAKAAEVVDVFGMKMPRLNALQFNTAHDFEHYGNIVTYMRLKGMVPPSSQKGGM
jgi:uncharacterized damage-inducible protein DinB